MPDDTQVSNLGLEKLLIQMEANLSKRMGTVEDNVEKRMDKFESSMEQYVLKEVFHIEMLNVRNELYAAKRDAETRQESALDAAQEDADKRQAAADKKQNTRQQRISWIIALAAVLVTGINVLIG